MKGSTGRVNSNSNSSASSRTQQALRSSLNAQPFVPDSRASSFSPVTGQGDAKGLDPYASVATAANREFCAEQKCEYFFLLHLCAPGARVAFLLIHTDIHTGGDDSL